MVQLYLLVASAPLAGAIVVGLWGPKLGRVRVALDLHRRGRDLHGRVGVDPARRARRQHLQRRPLHLDDLGRDQVRDRLPDRPTDRVDDGRRDLRVADGAHLHHRLHVGRRRLYALLCVHLAVHLQHADAGDGEQLPAAVLRLGSGGPRVLSADRLLYDATDRHLRQSQGVPGQPRRRLRLRARHRADRRVFRFARLRHGVPRGAAARQYDDRTWSGARSGC